MRFKLVGIGELLWDLLPEGPKMGGAPANFAYHAAELGAEARVISRTGNDDLGRALIDQMQQLGLPSDCVEIDHSLPTGTVSVQFGADREPIYVIHEPAAWDNLAGESSAREAVKSADAICFGTLAQRDARSRAAIRSLLEQTSPSALRIFDVNLRQNYYSHSIIADSLSLANVLKINETELPILAKLLEIAGDDQTQISQLATRFNLRAIAYTRGKRGSLLFLDGHWSDHPGAPCQLADPIGAGDSFTAAMSLGILTGWDAEKINQTANEVAAFVASRPGATPPLPDHLKSRFLR